ncbi:MAG: FtsB family cell division protein [Hyphomicrobiaceae bacterium]
MLLVCLCLTAYFAFHAVKGRHGLEARAALEVRKIRLESDLARLTIVRDRLQNETDLLSEAKPDPDYVTGLARDVLGYVRPNEIVLLSSTNAMDFRPTGSAGPGARR